MNKLLSSMRPDDTSSEEWEKHWNNASYTLEPLYKALAFLIKENISVKKDDFDCPNHYAKMAYQIGFSTALERVIDMLPDSAKPN